MIGTQVSEECLYLNVTDAQQQPQTIGLIMVHIPRSLTYFDGVDVHLTYSKTTIFPIKHTISFQNVQI